MMKPKTAFICVHNSFRAVIAAIEEKVLRLKAQLSSGELHNI